MRIGIIGLGYVGLPLAVAFSEFHRVTGYDISRKRIDELSQGIDQTDELSADELNLLHRIDFTCDINDLHECDIYIVTVPTPVNAEKVPDLSMLVGASEIVGSVLSKGNVVIYESTVYPGATEEICIPKLEENSGLKLSRDFMVGYSPERINPGDKEHRLKEIVKVVSGNDKYALQKVSQLYSKIIHAGIHEAPSIKVAEAAKVIENVQRDLNIALINDLSILFSKLKIDTKQVLDAASTKWNFLHFQPGLVGGHCIGIDPYYLTFKAQAVGHNPELILSGRRVNESMAAVICNRTLREMTNRDLLRTKSKILIAGFAFKENCPDVRNSKVYDIVEIFLNWGVIVDVWDPLVKKAVKASSPQIKFVDTPGNSTYDAIILATPHNMFVEMGPKMLRTFGKDNHVFFDVKSIFAPEWSDFRL